MSMISVETAKKLKEAGLEWKPRCLGDEYRTPEKTIGIICACTCEQETDGYYQERIWLPRLDELLAEIEKRGWQIELVKYARWRITIWKIQWRKQGLFIGETPGEVAAKALIWLLKQNESTNVSCTETLG